MSAYEIHLRGCPNGRVYGYAFGLSVGEYRGAREVSHGGSTAGYRAFLTRYPDHHLSVPVLRNGGNANPTQYAHTVAEAYLGRALGTVTFRRGPAGQVAELSIKLDRVWDLRFQRVP